jgi:hypothetical protein
MKWIKKRSQWVSEAKIGDVILPRQKEAVKRTWGEKFLDMEEVIPTEHIKQGDWELSEDDKFKVLDVLFGTDVKSAQDQYKDLPAKFIEMVNLSLAYLAETDVTGRVSDEMKRAKEVLGELDLTDIGIDEMIALNYPILRKLSNETGKAEMIQKDDAGRPVMGEDGRPIKIAKEIGEPIFEKNLINLESFRVEYNKYYDKVERDFNSRPLQLIINVVKQDHNSDYRTSYKLFNKPVHLKISHNPKDILNMSISKFYQSCQHLYTGGYRTQVLGNVFDPNSIPAYLVVKTPIYNGDDLLSEQLPIARSMVRYLDGFSKTDAPAFFFDRTYPDRLREVMYEIITKYSGMVSTGTQKNTGPVSRYTYAPDLPAQSAKDIPSPYQDSLGIEQKTYVGVNTKRLSTSMSGFKNMIISKQARVEELIVDSPDVPEALFDLPLKLNWIKFKFIDIKKMPKMDKFDCKSFAFDKCRFTNADLANVVAANPEMEKLQLTSCEVDDLNLSGLSVDELQLIYTTTQPLAEVLGDVKVKKLVISGDLLSDKENKDFVIGLKKSGVKVETVGLVI